MAKTQPGARASGGSLEAAARKARTNLANLAACVDDARAAALDTDAGPKDPADFANLEGRLPASRDKLPPLYREKVFDPFARTLKELGTSGFRQVLASDPDVEGEALVLFDVAQAILQNGERYSEQATDGFQEVVSDLYDGFLSAEDRRGVKPPDRGVIPPLVKWGRPDWGPYTLPIDAVRSVGAAAGVVSLPPANARAGLLAWAALGHETAGHDIIGADTGLREELAGTVRAALRRKGLEALADYWSSRIDETASDVMGILNMGPAAGIGIVGYFRGLNAAWGAAPRLRSVGPGEDEHPADVVRGYLAASTVRLLAFAGAAQWAKAIESETDADAADIRLAGKAVSREQAKRSAAVVAETLVRTRMKSLENHALGDIQDWRDRDERIARELRSVLTTSDALPNRVAAGVYAAHAVAAAVTEAVGGAADLRSLFHRLLALLKTMHDRNPSWGPLYVVHPGDLAPHVSYRRTAEE